jgi:hypothetical protein
MPREIPSTEIDAAVAELDAVRSEWLRRPEVTAVDVGYAVEGGRRLDELAIRVHVRRATPEVRESFPRRLGRFPVCFLEAEYGPQPP